VFYKFILVILLLSYCTLLATEYKLQRDYSVKMYLIAMNYKYELVNDLVGLPNEVSSELFIVVCKARIFSVVNRHSCTGRRQVIGRATGHVTLRWCAVPRSVSATFRVSAPASTNVGLTTARLPVQSAVASDSPSSVTSSYSRPPLNAVGNFQFR